MVLRPLLYSDELLWNAKMSSPIWLCVVPLFWQQLLRDGTYKNRPNTCTHISLVQIHECSYILGWTWFTSWWCLWFTL